MTDAIKQHLAALTAALERDPRFAGKRGADIPDLAMFRRKWRWRFYRVADANMFAAIFNVTLALAPIAWLWPVNVVAAAASIAGVFWAERRARTISRQLNRPAALQIARDALGLALDE
jgi:hypothetical protein